MLLNRKMNLLYYAEAVWTSAHLEARTVLMMIYLIGLLIPYSCAFQKYLVLPCTGPCSWISRIISRSCNVQPRRGIDSKAEIRYDSKVPKNILLQRLKFNILQCTVGLETAAAYAYQKSHHSRSYWPLYRCFFSCDFQPWPMMILTCKLDWVKLSHYSYIKILSNGHHYNHRTSAFYRNG